MKVINSNLTIEFTGEEALVLRRMIGEISEEHYEDFHLTKKIDTEVLDPLYNILCEFTGEDI